MADQLNYMIVDGVLKDLVEEIASYIDQLNGVEEGADGFFTAITELMNNEDEAQQEKIFEAIAEKSVVLTKAPEKQFEASYNLVLHILTFSSDIKDLLPIILNNLTTSVPSYSNGPLLVLTVLTNLFNILPVYSSLRVSVFNTIIDYAQSTNNIQLLIPQLKNLSRWLQEWGVSDADKQATYVKVSSILESLEAEASYKYLFEAVSSASSSDSFLSAKLAKTAITADFIYDFDQILSLDSIQKLRTDDPGLFSLLETVSNGDFAGFREFQNNNQTFFSDNSIDFPSLERKIKILTLASLASKSTSKVIKHAEIAQEIQVPTEEVEIWVIDTIRAGLVEGRLSQTTQTFEIHRSTPVGQFGIEQWKLVGQKLEKWKSGLREVVDVLKNARENAAREKSSNTKGKLPVATHV